MELRYGQSSLENATLIHFLVGFPPWTFFIFHTASLGHRTRETGSALIIRFVYFSNIIACTWRLWHAARRKRPQNRICVTDCPRSGLRFWILSAQSYAASPALPPEVASPPRFTTAPPCMHTRSRSYDNI